MVGYVENDRLVTCMELYYSESLKVGVIQIRAPPIKAEKFVNDLLEWFKSSGLIYLHPWTKMFPDIANTV